MAVVTLLVGAVALAAGATTAAAAASIKPYKGPESKYLYTYKKPKKKKGFKFTIGYLNPNGEEQSLDDEQAAAKAETRALGGKFVSYDASSSITTQVNQFNQLLAAHVSAILVYPNDPKSMTPDLTKAKAEHIPVIAISTPGIASEAPLPGYAADVDQSFDAAAYYQVAAVAAAAPHSSFATMGFALPVPALEYLVAREKYWGIKLGLKYLGNVDAAQDSTSAYSTAASTILAKWPTVKAVFSITPQGADTMTSLAQSQGKHILACGYGAPSTAYSLIKAGRIFCAGKAGFPQVGTDAVIAAYDELTKQNLPLPKTGVVPGNVVTKSDMKSVKPD